MPRSGAVSSSKIFWVAQALVCSVLVGLLLFGCAGRTDIVPFWLYVFVCSVTFVVGAYVLDPDLLRERMRPGGHRLQLRYYVLLFLPLAHWCVAGLDVGRFHWSDRVPQLLQIEAFVLCTLALGMIIWAMRVNRFFSSVIRLQDDRGHELVCNGPYRWVRHPGYTAVFLICLSSGVALGSWLSMLPAVACIPLLLIRTVAEDRFLKKNLKGYSAYADTVRYRMVPGIW